MNHTAPTTSLLETIKSPEIGSAEDKLRLFLINYICSEVPEVGARFQCNIPRLLYEWFAGGTRAISCCTGSWWLPIGVTQVSQTVEVSFV